MASPLDDLDVCLLAWREAPAMLQRFHDALAAGLPEGWAGSIVLVENAGSAATAAAAERLVRERHPHARRVVLRLPRNLGYARAMDLALAQCRGRWVAFLNSDGAVEPGTLATLVAALRDDPGALVAAPGIHGPGEPDHPAGPPFEEEELAGMALVARRAELVALGAFDPLYVHYNEDFDCSARARAAGWRLLRVPDARFHHGKGGRSRRGAALRELLFAWTRQVQVHHRAPTHADAARQLAVSRARSLRDHARAGTWPAAAGIAAALVGWPAAALLAERRRRRPWDGAQYAAWVRRTQARLGVEAEAL